MRNDSPGSVEGIGPVLNEKEDNTDPSTEPKPEQSLPNEVGRAIFGTRVFIKVTRKATKTYEDSQMTVSFPVIVISRKIAT